MFRSRLPQVESRRPDRKVAREDDGKFANRSGSPPTIEFLYPTGPGTGEAGPAQPRPRHRRRTYPCRPVRTERMVQPVRGRFPAGIRNAGSAARRNSGSRRARDRRLNLFSERDAGSIRSVLRPPCSGDVDRAELHDQMTIRACARPARTTRDPSHPLQISATIEFLLPHTHRGLDLAAPSEPESPASLSIRCTRLVRRDLLGGLIHEYELAA
jgi:hypothetical protein